MGNKVTRLNFIKTAGLAASGVMLGKSAAANTTGPEIVPVNTVRSPARKVNLALIGIANQGAGDARQFINSGLANIVAVCDVDLDSKGCQETIKLAPKAKQFRDFRVMFDKMAGDIDAVQVAIPTLPISRFAWQQCSSGKAFLLKSR